MKGEDADFILSVWCLLWRMQDSKEEAAAEIEALTAAKRKLERKLAAVAARSSALKEANAAQSLTVQGLQVNVSYPMLVPLPAPPEPVGGCPQEHLPRQEATVRDSAEAARLEMPPFSVLYRDLHACYHHCGHI